MATWKKTLDLTDIAQRYEETENAQAYATGVSLRIEAFIKSNEKWLEREQIKEDLEELSKQFLYDETEDEINDHLSELYDIADWNHIWIATF
jgi:hypothetical protein